MWTDINWWAILLILGLEIAQTVFFVVDSRKPYSPNPVPFVLFNWCVGLAMVAVNVPMVQAWWVSP